MSRVFYIFLICTFCGTLAACSSQGALNYFPFLGNNNDGKGVNPEEVKVYPLNIDSLYLTYIIEGKKTSEGRLNLPDFSYMEPGDLILFYDDYGNTAVCAVNRVTRYPTFERMLVSEGVYNMLPEIDPENNSSVEMVVKGVVVYDSFPGYQEGVKVCGAIAFTLRYDGSQLPEPYLKVDIKEFR